MFDKRLNLAMSGTHYQDKDCGVITIGGMEMYDFKIRPESRDIPVKKIE